MTASHSIVYICTRLSTPSYLPLIPAQPPPSSLCFPSQSSRHPPNLTTVFLVPALHLLLPSTPFYNHTVLIRSLHVSKPYQYYLIHSTHHFPFYIPALLPTSSFLTLSIVSCRPRCVSGMTFTETFDGLT